MMMMMMMRRRRRRKHNFSSVHAFPLICFCSFLFFSLFYSSVLSSIFSIAQPRRPSSPPFRLPQYIALLTH